MTPMLAVPNLSKTTPAFREELVRLAGKLGLNPSFIAAVMSRESGFNPQAVNPFTKATGLIQFMPNTAKVLGTTVDALFNMSAVAQLFFVGKYFAPFADKLSTPGDYYMAVFMPAHIGKPADFVLFKKGEKGYEQNAGLDLDKDGTIKVGDVTRAIDQTVQKAQTQAPVMVDENSPKVSPAPSSHSPSLGSASASSSKHSASNRADLPVLHLGSEGTAVELFRRFAIGGNGPITQEDIENHIKPWQKRHGCVPDGIIGSKSWSTFLMLWR